jgi:hypothetical protein
MTIRRTQYTRLPLTQTPSRESSEKSNPPINSDLANDIHLHQQDHRDFDSYMRIQEGVEVVHTLFLQPSRILNDFYIIQ